MLSTILLLALLKLIQQELETVYLQYYQTPKDNKFESYDL